MIKKIKEQVRSLLLSQSAGMLYREKVDKTEIEEYIKEILTDIAYRDHVTISATDERTIISELIDEIAGYGPIQKLMDDPEITEIMINGPSTIYIEKHGKKELSGIVFEDDQQLRCLIHKIVGPTRRRVDELFPYVDLALPDGSRINIIIPPLAHDGACVTIRKFLSNIDSVDNLVQLGTLDKRMADFLIACIKAKINIIFCGATGSGKTTTLGALSNHIDRQERIVTIEDTIELHLNQEHVVRLEARPANIEGKGEVSIRDLFKNSLRMRPERIIIGEVRGAEALDMLQSMCSGHTGSLAVLHASSPQEAIYRLETMILTSGLPISLDVIHRQIAAAVHIIVHQEQFMDGSRKISYITQVNGMKDGRVVLEDLFKFELENSVTEGKIKGNWKAKGVVPVFYPLFEKKRVALSKELFKKDE